MDAFSEILQGVKLKGALYFRAEFSAPWGVTAPHASALAPALAPGASHLVIYHFVVGGVALVRLNDGAAVAVGPGDVVLIPHGDAHSFSNGTFAEQIEYSAIAKKVLAHDLTPMRAGGGGATTRFICGYMVCDPLLCRPILDGLPPLVKVNIRTDRSGQWLESSILHLVEEAASGRAGSEAILAKLSEALFVDTLRRHVAQMPERRAGWLAGACDPIVGRSLALLHSRVDHAWTIADLAKQVGLSRSALVERFSRHLAEPPMSYLARWRLQLAARALTSTPRGIAQIASEVGYQSEAAFHRAFKREFGAPPAQYRRQVASAPELRQ